MYYIYLNFGSQRVGTLGFIVCLHSLLCTVLYVRQYCIWGYLGSYFHSRTMIVRKENSKKGQISSTKETLSLKDGCINHNQENANPRPNCVLYADRHTQALETFLLVPLKETHLPSITPTHPAIESK